MNHIQPHRADSDAEATSQLFLEIMERLSELPKVSLEKLGELTNKLKSDVGSLIYRWTTLQNGDIDKFNFLHGLAVKKDEPQEQKESYDDEQRFISFYDKCLNNDEWCKKRMKGYEVRPGQLEMIKFVYKTLEKREIGLIEAGTGTGKTLAYLIPAIFLAKEGKKPVVISTQTIQLQEQIIHKELENVTKFLPFSVNSILLKGRSHYLCLRKFAKLLKDDPLETYERTVAKGQIIVWLTETVTGDVEELSLGGASKRFWTEISSDSFTCVTHNCFYQIARKKAQRADLIVTNHSLVLADVRAEQQLLPNYDRIILDEAHHFEETAADQLGLQLDYLSFTQLFSELGFGEGVEGYLSSLKKISESETLKIKIGNVEARGKVVREEWYELFLLLFQYIQEKKGKFNERGRITVKLDLKEDAWRNPQEAVDRFSFAFEEWYQGVKELSLQLGDRNIANKVRLNAFIDRMEKFFDTYVSLLIKQDNDLIFWLEGEGKGPKTSIYIKGRPIKVSDYLGEQFFQKKESVILTSATLTVSGKFNYFLTRLGLEDFPVETKIVESPFDWKNQVKLIVPKDMPMIQEAGEEFYVESAVMQIYRIAQATNGKMLVLFTSYDMLKKSYLHLKDMLADDYMLIAQGVQTGSRNKLTRNFQQFEKSILLGTTSFWEGVDIPGSDLSVIVMVRLPFSPPDDPLFKAKASILEKKGDNPFFKLTLPQAVIRFKQGFGRLIRTSSDKGIVVVLDRRIINARYGSTFIKSLPTIPLEEKTMGELEQLLPKWLS
ncbi:MAG: ATP-dependent DNA helicase DinG [Bacillus sp. (in: Bacteria)]|nr:ATP-dependent DNA helicase DinG [Bacillus sp. (in: firmicutes)]